MTNTDTAFTREYVEKLIHDIRSRGSIVSGFLDLHLMMLEDNEIDLEMFENNIRMMQSSLQELFGILEEADERAKHL